MKRLQQFLQMCKNQKKLEMYLLRVNTETKQQSMKIIKAFATPMKKVSTSGSAFPVRPHTKAQLILPIPILIEAASVTVNQ